MWVFSDINFIDRVLGKDLVMTNENNYSQQHLFQC